MVHYYLLGLLIYTLPTPIFYSTPGQLLIRKIGELDTSDEVPQIYADCTAALENGANSGLARHVFIVRGDREKVDSLARNINKGGHDSFKNVGIHVVATFCEDLITLQEPSIMPGSFVRYLEEDTKEGTRSLLFTGGIGLAIVRKIGTEMSNPRKHVFILWLRLLRELSTENSRRRTGLDPGIILSRLCRVLRISEHKPDPKLTPKPKPNELKRIWSARLELIKKFLAFCIDSAVLPQFHSALFQKTRLPDQPVVASIV